MFPAFRAFSYAEYEYGVIYALIPFTSGSFHTCDEYQVCLFQFTYQRDLDYFFAMFMLPMTGLYIVHWRHIWRPLRNVLLMLFALLLAFTLYWGGGTIGGMVLFAAIAVGIPVVYWCGYAASACIDYPNDYSLRRVCCCESTEDERIPGGRYFPKYEWGNLFAGVALTALGVIMFIMQTTFTYEWWWATHSLWHCVEAFGQWYILACKAPPPIASYKILGARAPLKDHQRALLKDHLYSELIDDIYRDPLRPIELLLNFK